MAVKISGVEKKSPCAKKGIKSGYSLLSVNGNEINDVLDYRFYTEDDILNMLFLSEKGKYKKCKIKNAGSADSLGLVFDTYLMDRHRHCKNNCIFCFIDQMPEGMRESLYFKDDDSRLSFLFGNYITLTNLSEREAERIIKMHISPVNVSVHTMNPALRVKMMRNPNAGKALSLLKRFSAAGISINAQLVLCPGINDGKELEFSLRELGGLSSLNSVAAVPVGLTKHRENLYELNAFTPENAAAVIDAIDAFNEELVKAGREKAAFPSDEFFLIAGRKIPDAEYYRDFPQLENGVGMYALTLKEFNEAMNFCEADRRSRSFALATGEAASPLISMLADAFMKKFTKSEIKVYCIKNEFFGGKVTVAGLITGQDLIKSLKDSGFCSEKLLLPSVMFKSSDEPVLLDNISPEDIERELNTEVVISSCSGGDLFSLFFSL